MLSALSYLTAEGWRAVVRVVPARLYVTSAGVMQLDALVLTRRSPLPHDAAAASVEWLAPEEITDGRRCASTASFHVGVCVLELCNGRRPELPTHAVRAARVIVTGATPTLDQPAHWSSALAHFIAMALVKAPLQRPEPAALLEHAWLRGASHAPLAALYAQRPSFDAATDVTSDAASTADTLASTVHDHDHDHRPPDPALTANRGRGGTSLAMMAALRRLWRGEGEGEGEGQSWDAMDVAAAMAAAGLVGAAIVVALALSKRL